LSINKRSLRKNGNGKGALTTIVLGHGEHIEEGRYVTLKCPVHILGSNDVLDHCNIIVVGGFAVHRNVLGTYYNITIRQSKEHGVRGYSSFFTLNGIITEQCDCIGVVAYDFSTLARCANLLVRRLNVERVEWVQGRADRSFWTEHSGRNILDGIEASCLVGGSDSGLHVNAPSSKFK
jgi:hypothetical protein